MHGTTNRVDKFHIIFIHIILMGANFLYLGYQVQSKDHYIPYYFTMLFLIDQASIYCLYLLDKSIENEETLPDRKTDKYIISGCSIILWINFIVAWFLPEGYGVRCKPKTHELSFYFMGLFQVLWTFYVLNKLGNIKV